VVEDEPLATGREIAAEGYWFGPRSGLLGWGWRPVSWQGWLVVALTILALVAATLLGPDDRRTPLYVLAVIALSSATCGWKGTSPGPSKAATRQLKEIAARQRSTGPR
jgi:hypothetical protein